MNFLIDDARKRAVSDLFSDSVAEIADFEAGEVRKIGVALVSEIASPTGARIFEPKDISDYTFRAVISGGVIAPLAGTYTLSFDGGTTATIPFDASAETVDSLLNDVSEVTAAGGVTVTGEDGYFFVTFSEEGSKPEITGNAIELAPLSAVDVGTLLEGSAEVKEVQTLRVLQQPATFVDLETLSAAAGATLTTLQVGGGGNNHKVRVKLSPVPYDGKWTYSSDGDESDLIAFDASAEDVLAILEAMESIGSGNVEVVKEAEFQWLIAYRGDHANESIPGISVDGSALRAVQYMQGDLHLDVPGIELLLGNETEITVDFAIRATPPGSDPFTVLRRSVTLRNSDFTPISETPQPRDSYYTKDETDEGFEPKHPFKVYSATLTQTGTANPVATVLENTLGVTIAWTRDSFGQYIGTASASIFDDPAENTFVLTGGIPGFISANIADDVTIELTTKDTSGVNTDELLNKTAIEIRDYV